MCIAFKNEIDNKNVQYNEAAVVMRNCNLEAEEHDLPSDASGWKTSLKKNDSAKEEKKETCRYFPRKLYRKE